MRSWRGIQGAIQVTIETVLNLVMSHLQVSFVLLLSWFSGPGHKRSADQLCSAVNADYVGLERMANLTPDDPQTEWFHENTLIVYGSDAVIDEIPITIRNGSKSYSASDGGFLTYRARFFAKDGQEFIEMRLFRSDYFKRPVGRDPYSEIKTYAVKCSPSRLEINGVRYTRKTISKAKHLELLRFLDQEPMEMRK